MLAFIVFVKDMLRIVNIYQKSHDLYEVSCKSFDSFEEQKNSLLKKYTTYNPSTLMYELKEKYYLEFTMQISKIENVLINYPNRTFFREIIDEFHHDKYQSIKSNGLRKRMLILDEFMIKRYKYCSKYFKQNEQKRVLLVCSQIQIKEWEWKFIKESKLSSVIFKDKDEKKVLEKDLFQYLTYEQLAKIHREVFTQERLKSYSTIIIDDSELWIYKEKQRKTMLEFLELFGNKKEILLFTGKIRWDTQQFKIISQIFVRNLFIKQENKIFLADFEEGERKRELLYLYKSTFLVDLSEENLPSIGKQTKIGAILQHNTVYLPLSYQKAEEFKLSYKDSQQKILNNLQYPGFQQIVSHDFFRSLNNKIDQIFNMRLPEMMRWIEYFSKGLNQRVAIVVDNKKRHKVFEQTLNNMEIDYAVYKVEGQCKDFTKFTPLSLKAKVILIFREQIMKKIKSFERQFVKDERLKQEDSFLIFKQGQGFTISQFFKKLRLPKILFFRHILFADTHLENFSIEKEFLLNNIFMHRKTSQVDVIGHFLCFNQIADQLYLRTYMRNYQRFILSCQKTVRKQKLSRQSFKRSKFSKDGYYNTDTEIQKLEKEAEKKEKPEIEEDSEVFNDTKEEKKLLFSRSKQNLPHSQFMRASKLLNMKQQEKSPNQNKTKLKEKCSTAKQFFSKRKIERDDNYTIVLTNPTLLARQHSNEEEQYDRQGNSRPGRRT